jgi:hypothetical protein
MFLAKLKVAAVVLLALGVAGAGTAGLAYRARAAGRPEAGPPGPGKPAPARAETDKAARERLEEEVRKLRQLVAKLQTQAEVERLKFLVQRKAQQVEEELKRSREEIDGVLRGVLKGVDVEKNTVSLTLGRTKLALEAVPISVDAKFYLGDKECSINDLKPGMPASLRVVSEKDKSVVVLIRGRAVTKK